VGACATRGFHGLPLFTGLQPARLAHEHSALHHSFDLPPATCHLPAAWGGGMQAMGRIAADLAAREWLPAITGSTGGGAASGEGGLADSCDPIFRAYKVTIYDWADDCGHAFNVSVTCPPGQQPAP
jgi:hypothetical protein